MADRGEVQRERARGLRGHGGDDRDTVADATGHAERPARPPEESPPEPIEIEIETPTATPEPVEIEVDEHFEDEPADSEPAPAPRPPRRPPASPRPPQRPAPPPMRRRAVRPGDFLASLSAGIARGLDLAAALEAAAVALPGPARQTAEGISRRLRGDYVQDEWGYDEELVDLARPFFEFMYERWWRVEAVGVERIPANGPTMLVANHAGVLPWDATMMSVAIAKHHPSPRQPRFMVLDWAFRLPWVSSFMRRVGGVVASPYNAMRLLDQGHLVMVFPEGVKGAGKPYSERYRLQRFGRGGFVEIALRTDASIVPVAVVGSEEIYPKLAESRLLARLLGTPYFPITPTFPALGVLGAVPLPSKWRIEFCEPVDLSRYGPEAAEDRAAVFEVSERVRETIQERVLQNLVKRGWAFF